MILVDRALADSQELLIAISKSYSFPGMHYVTREEGKGADGQILITRVIIYFPSCPFFPLSLLPIGFTQTKPDLFKMCLYSDMVWRDRRGYDKLNYGSAVPTTVGLPYVPN